MSEFGFGEFALPAGQDWTLDDLEVIRRRITQMLIEGDDQYKMARKLYDKPALGSVSRQELEAARAFSDMAEQEAIKIIERFVHPADKDLVNQSLSASLWKPRPRATEPESPRLTELEPPKTAGQEDPPDWFLADEEPTPEEIADLEARKQEVRQEKSPKKSINDPERVRDRRLATLARREEWLGRRTRRYNQLEDPQPVVDVWVTAKNEDAHKELNELSESVSSEVAKKTKKSKKQVVKQRIRSLRSGPSNAKPLPTPQVEGETFTGELDPKTNYRRGDPAPKERQLPARRMVQRAGESLKQRGVPTKETVQPRDLKSGKYNPADLPSSPKDYRHIARPEGLTANDEWVLQNLAKLEQSGDDFSLLKRIRGLRDQKVGSPVLQRLLKELESDINDRDPVARHLVDLEEQQAYLMKADRKIAETRGTRYPNPADLPPARRRGEKRSTLLSRQARGKAMAEEAELRRQGVYDAAEAYRRSHEARRRQLYKGPGPYKQTARPGQGVGFAGAFPEDPVLSGLPESFTPRQRELAILLSDGDLLDPNAPKTVKRFQRALAQVARRTGLPADIFNPPSGGTPYIEIPKGPMAGRRGLGDVMRGKLKMSTFLKHYLGKNRYKQLPKDQVRTLDTFSKVYAKKNRYARISQGISQSDLRDILKREAGASDEMVEGILKLGAKGRQGISLKEILAATADVPGGGRPKEGVLAKVVDKILKRQGVGATSEDLKKVMAWRLTGAPDFEAATPKLQKMSIEAAEELGRRGVSTFARTGRRALMGMGWGGLGLLAADAIFSIMTLSDIGSKQARADRIAATGATSTEPGAERAVSLDVLRAQKRVQDAIDRRRHVLETYEPELLGRLRQTLATHGTAPPPSDLEPGTKMIGAPQPRYKAEERPRRVTEAMLNELLKGLGG